MVASTKGKKLSLLKGKKPRETSHPIVIDHEAVESYAAARRELIEAEAKLLASRRRNDPKVTLDEFQAKLDSAQAEADRLEPAADEGEGFITVRLRAMLPLAYAALRAEFPATEEDHARIRELTGDDKAKAQWNRDEFQPRLVAHSLVDPEVDVDQAREWMTTWSEVEWNMLVSACLRVNQETVDTTALSFSSGRTRT